MNTEDTVIVDGNPVMLRDLAVDPVSKTGSIGAVVLIQTIAELWPGENYREQLDAIAETMVRENFRGITLENIFRAVGCNVADLFALMIAVDAELVEGKDVRLGAAEWGTVFPMREIVSRLCPCLEGFEAFYDSFARRQEDFAAAMDAKIDHLEKNYLEQPLAAGPVEPTPTAPNYEAMLRAFKPQPGCKPN